MNLRRLPAAAPILLLLATACGGGGEGTTGEQEPPCAHVTPPAFGDPFDALADWHLFTDAALQTPACEVTPYEVNSPLFTDYATKLRYLFVPEGKTIGYSDEGGWDLPLGSALVKTFAMRADLADASSALRLLETRVIFHEPDGWSVQTYVWSEDQKEATRDVAGPTIEMTLSGEHGETVHEEYTVPNTVECQKCHQSFDATVPLGLKTRQLDREHDYGGTVGKKNQIDQLDAMGLFASKPPPASARTALVDPYGTAGIDLRVRAYWDGNCGHCHTKGGYATESSLRLDYLSTDFANGDPTNWGVCKAPSSAGGATCGNVYDVVPGDPDASIMSCRVESTDADVRMPPLGMFLLNAEGLDVIRTWIASLPKQACQ